LTTLEIEKVGITSWAGAADAVTGNNNAVIRMNTDMTVFSFFMRTSPRV